MEEVVIAAARLLGNVVTKLSDVLVAAYVDSLELGQNSQQIKTKLLHVQGLLQVSQWRDVSNVPALQDLLAELSKKADEAEDLLDELHYFKIQDQLDGTNEATTQEANPDLGDLVSHQALHSRHALRHTVGNCLRCFSCAPTQDDDVVVANNPPNATNSNDADVSDHVDKLTFDRVAMCEKIKSVIMDIGSRLCDPVSDLLSKIPHSSATVTVSRPHIGSTIIQDTLYGRRDIFERTVHDITRCTETLSVLPVVGPGGIGKTTFTQHLYNDTRTKEHFTVKVWVCVSTDFDVLKLTQQILGCIPQTGNEGSSTAYVTTNLDRLQNSIAERLESKRILLVLDDIWKCSSVGEWKTLLAPLKKGAVKGSMVLVTTRFPYIANMVRTTAPVELQGLKSNDFLKFFEACIFGEHEPEHYKYELAAIAREIASKLKGSPLAAKTVGRLLENNLSPEHWSGVLQSSEWRNQKNDDDIMPSLKISYNYLAIQLKKCFSYFALFPEDHRFPSLEINRFWIALGIIDSNQAGDKNYLEELVNNGFLMKEVKSLSQYYVMHDLMHELSRIVSAQECLNISCLDFRADTLPQSVRHLSITIENKYDENFVEGMSKLKRRIDIANLRTLMVFRQYEENIVEILNDTLKEINGLRILFIVVKSLESFPRRFSKLIHLQYLKIRSHKRDLILPSTLTRFYHLKFLDLENWCGSSNLPKDFSRLVNLRDFIANNKLHSNVPEVGKMKYLQELKKFCVKKERDGFELRELGELTELEGTLSVCNLENVGTKEEASEAKLMLKKNLKKLRLDWGREQPTIDADVLDFLKPHSNLRALCIINHCGTSGPSWLCLDISVKSLESLHLEGVSWVTLPPFGQLTHLKKLSLEMISKVHQLGPNYGGVTGKCFMHLKKVVFDDLPELVKWVVEPNCHSFPTLEIIRCSDCPKLCMMPFSECSCTNLRRLDIYNCPKLALPAMPHTSTLTDFYVSDDHSLMLTYNEKSLVVRRYDGDLAFHNLDKVQDLRIVHISLTDLEKLKSLRKLDVRRCDSMFSEELDSSAVFPSVDSLRVDVSHITGKLLSKVFTCFPALSELDISSWDKDGEERVVQFPSSSSLRSLSFSDCKGLVLEPVEDGGIQGITTLQSLTIQYCGKLVSRWHVREAGGAQTINPFPASLRELDVSYESSMQSMALLSNLTSLTRLRLESCFDLTMDGFNPLITDNLKELVVSNMKMGENDPDSVAADLLSEVVARTQLMPAGSFQLEKLVVDSIPAVLVAPMCKLLAATLHTLEFYNDKQAESFTEEQEKALQLLTSLQNLRFINSNLQSLPEGLHCLSSLKELEVGCCYKLQWLPKEGFPTSLQKLRIGPNQLSAELKKQFDTIFLRQAQGGGRPPSLNIYHTTRRGEEGENEPKFENYRRDEIYSQTVLARAFP